jgi:DNA-binding beta-propeller fold protein YncE
LFAPDGASLFVAVPAPPGRTRLARLPREGGPPTEVVIEGEASTLRPTPNGATLLAAVSGPGAGLAFASTQSLRVELLEIPCDARDVVLTAPADRAYVLCAEGRVAEVDLDLRLVIKTADLPGGNTGCKPVGADLSANGTVLLVACSASGWLYYLDRLTLAPLDSAQIPVGTSGLVAALGGTRVLLAVPPEGSVVVLDIRGRAIRGRIPVEGIADIAVTADGRRAFVAGASRLLELDAAEGRVLRSVPLGHRPTAVAVWPGPREPRLRWDETAVNASASAAPGERW